MLRKYKEIKRRKYTAFTEPPSLRHCLLYRRYCRRLLRIQKRPEFLLFSLLMDSEMFPRLKYVSHIFLIFLPCFNSRSGEKYGMDDEAPNRNCCHRKYCRKHNTLGGKFLISMIFQRQDRSCRPCRHGCQSNGNSCYY